MYYQELVQKIFELVMKELAALEDSQTAGPPDAGCRPCEEKSKPPAQTSGQDRACVSLEVSKKVLSESDVKQAHMRGACELIVPRNAIITCLASEYAIQRNITITRKNS